MSGSMPSSHFCFLSIMWGVGDLFSIVAACHHLFVEKRKFLLALIFSIVLVGIFFSVDVNVFLIFFFLFLGLAVCIRFS
jgi:hypothetical protein